ncbi:helix-turn-helix domain-containing protein [Exiguobacterium antarcticum]|uniref:helix-turn-helix domain-containing protein n=1 Tax=Exiguobacterium antarcticum TaxID=132920 RepID=UPI003CE4E60F
MSYVHLTTSERVKIETYLELGFSVRKIAGRLGRQPSTISRELRRNPHYAASHANQRYVERKKKCGARAKFTFEKGVRDLSIASLLPVGNVLNCDDRSWKRV